MSSSPSSSAPAVRLRAPISTGQLVHHPALAAALEIAERNRLAVAACKIALGGLPLDEFRRQARAACIAATTAWMPSALAFSPPHCTPADLWIMAGHQPELVHPGVWMKNLAVADLSQRAGGAGWQLIVDNDLVAERSVRVPAGTATAPVFRDIAFDQPASRQPWEEARVTDLETFREFPERVADSLSPWGVQPVASAVWPAAVAVAERTGQLAPALTAARVALERRWGSGNCELPLSELCQTEPFLAFVSEICHSHEAFHTAHQRALLAFRQRYRIRNSQRPFPDLQRDGESFELPFWHWRPGAVERERIFARRGRQGVELWTRHEHLTTLPGGPHDTPALLALQEQGRLRTRAVTTTLFARLALADLFLHGLGGARYDEVTDALWRLWKGYEPPGYLTLSATLHLPLNAPPSNGDAAGQLRARQRQLRFNPTQLVDDPELSQLTARRAALLAAAPVAGPDSTRRERRQLAWERRAVHREVRAITTQLATLAEPHLAKMAQQLAELRMSAQRARVLASREYAFLLYPEPLLQQLAQKVQRAVGGADVED